MSKVSYLPSSHVERFLRKTAITQSISEKMLQPLPQPKMTISGGIVEVSVEETLRKVKIKLRKRFEIPPGFTSESKVPPASNHLPFLSLSQLFEDFSFFFTKIK